MNLLEFLKERLIDMKANQLADRIGAVLGVPLQQVFILGR
jgi:hypothetical protein